MGRVVSRDELRRAASQRIARAGRTIAFANGCFDLLHVGHVRYLQAAARGGRSADRRRSTTMRSAGAKGPGRPILPAADRAELVAALRGVDYVVDLPGADRHAAAASCCSPTCTARAPTTPSTRCPSATPSAPTAAASRSSATRRIIRRAICCARIRAMNILIVRLGALGDIVHALPAAAALRARLSRRAHRLAGRREASRVRSTW